MLPQVQPVEAVAAAWWAQAARLPQLEKVTQAVLDREAGYMAAAAAAALVRRAQTARLR